MKPRALRIGGARWKVRWSKKAVDRLARDKVSGGACSQRWLTIAVEPLPASPVAEREVLLHEVIHACVMASAVPWAEKTEERFVATVSPRLLEVLRDNPALVRYLTEKL